MPGKRNNLNRPADKNQTRPWAKPTRVLASRNETVMLREGAHTELEYLKTQVEPKTPAMTDIILDKETIDKVAEYLQTVLQRDTL